ncbi:hypothetical protein ARMGADRAFT_1015370 [Armillaria gallica]|uniref:Uncharacterized protein n=1 Tax=Armillaria gallica TaxID=47427 RepID=A0A2H3DJE4_ARMGA|nr:hypothetical protein ARMGADRAFT_1015370 [Armillaria gallica]
MPLFQIPEPYEYLFHIWKIFSAPNLKNQGFTYLLRPSELGLLDLHFTEIICTEKNQDFFHRTALRCRLNFILFVICDNFEDC